MTTPTAEVVETKEPERRKGIPLRRYTLTIQIGADEWSEIVADLKHLASHIEDHGEKCSSVMGGPSCGHIVGITIDPEMTHERYMDELDAYLSDGARSAREREAALQPLRAARDRAAVELARQIVASEYDEAKERDLKQEFCVALHAIAAAEAARGGTS